MNELSREDNIIFKSKRQFQAPGTLHLPQECFLNNKREKE